MEPMVPQEKFYSLATFGHNREYNQVPHKCHVYGCVYHASVSRITRGHGSVGPGQKALPSMNEFTLLWIFA